VRLLPRRPVFSENDKGEITATAELEPDIEKGMAEYVKAFLNGTLGAEVVIDTAPLFIAMLKILRINYDINAAKANELKLFSTDYICEFMLAVAGLKKVEPSENGPETISESTELTPEG
jgi:hypothetical protein